MRATGAITGTRSTLAPARPGQTEPRQTTLTRLTSPLKIPSTGQFCGAVLRCPSRLHRKTKRQSLNTSEILVRSADPPVLGGTFPCLVATESIRCASTRTTYGTYILATLRPPQSLAFAVDNSKRLPITTAEQSDKFKGFFYPWLSLHLLRLRFSTIVSLRNPQPKPRLRNLRQLRVIVEIVPPESPPKRIHYDFVSPDYAISGDLAFLSLPHGAVSAKVAASSVRLSRRVRLSSQALQW